MKKINLVRTAIILSSLLFFQVTAVAAIQRDSIRLFVHDFCPYICQNPDGSFVGSAFDSVKYACDKMGIHMTLIRIPWKRGQLLVYRGEGDGFFAASRNNYRDNNAVRSSTIARQTWCWYTLKSSPITPASPDFKEVAKVGAFHGSNMLNWIKKEHFRVVGNPKSTESLVKMLLMKRLDAILASSQVMEKIMERDKLADRVNCSVYRDKPLKVYFSKKYIKEHPGFLEEFNMHVDNYMKQKFSE